MSLTLKRLLVWGLVSAGATAGMTAAGDLPLVEAVKSRNIDVVRGLLKQRVDVNVPEGDGTTALHWAVHRDDLATTDLLLRAGARVNAATDTGVTPIFLACTNRNGALVERLLAASADPNAMLLSGETVLMQCALAGELRGVRALLTRGAHVDAKESAHAQTALMWAAGQGHARVVEALIESGADVRARSRVYAQIVTSDRQREDATYHTMRGGSSPLLFAVRSGDVETARVLLAAGADVNDAAPNGVSALVQAAHSGHDALATFLLEKGADPNNATAGYDSLQAAVLRSDLSLVKALLAHGANPNSVITRGTPIRRDSQDFDLPAALVGATPYFLASKFLELEIMPVLAAAGANTRAPMPDGTTPLMAAVGLGVAAQTDRYGHHIRDGARILPESRVTAAVRQALELGSDVSAANRDGNTALHAAALQGFDDVVRMLLERGVEVNPRNKRGQTPLSLLVRGTGGRLLASGALNIPDVHPTTVLILRMAGAVE